MCMPGAERPVVKPSSQCSAQYRMPASQHGPSGIQLIARENHVAGSGIVPMAKATTSASGKGARGWAQHGKLAWVTGARAGVTRNRDSD